MLMERTPRQHSLRVFASHGARIRKGGGCGWKPSSSSNFSARAVRAHPLVEIKQTVPCRAILRRQYLSQQYPPPSQKYDSRNSGVRPKPILIFDGSNSSGQREAHKFLDPGVLPREFTTVIYPPTFTITAPV